MSYINKPRLQSRELRKSIKEFKKLNLRIIDIDDLKKTLAPILHRYIHPAPLIQPGEFVFRAVLWNDKPSLITHLSYPPPERVGYGRCNRPGAPIFYGSTAGISAIQELAPAHNARLVLSMWRVTQPILAACVGYSERTFIDLGSNRWPDIWWQKQESPELDPVGARTSENSLINRFLAKEFTRSIPRDEAWKYKLSASIAETYLKGQAADTATGEISGLLRVGERIAGVKLSALIYPSIAVSANNDNIAINCATADSSLSLMWAQYIEIERQRENADEFNPKGLDFCHSIKSTDELDWLGHFPNNFVPGSDLRLEIDGGELVLKDSNNRIAG